MITLSGAPEIRVAPCKTACDGDDVEGARCSGMLQFVEPASMPDWERRGLTNRHHALQRAFQGFLNSNILLDSRTRLRHAAAHL